MSARRLKDRVAIVTGASRGIGAAVARVLAEKGARVVLAARSKTDLENLAGELPGSWPCVCDVTDRASVRALVQGTLKRFGRIDVLVNNAGLLIYRPIADTPVEEARRLMETNFFGAAVCVEEVLPAMRRRRSGVIANVSSVAGRVGFPNLGFYGASKFALTGYSEALRQELRREGIAVVTISPGTVATPMTEEILRRARERGKRGRAMNVRPAAEVIVRAIEREALECLFPFTSRMVVRLHFLFPRLTEWLADRYRALGEKAEPTS